MGIQKEKTKQLSRKPIQRASAFVLALMLTIVSMPAITARADDERTLSTSIKISYSYDGYYYSRSYDVTFTGTGNFIARTYFYNRDDGGSEYRLFLFSNEEFSYVVDSTFYNSKTGVTTTSSSSNCSLNYSGIYANHPVDLVFGSSYDDFTISAPNLVFFSTYEEFNTYLTEDFPFFDLSDFGVDDYLSDDALEDDALYYPDLDFSSISADYKAKFTIEKNSDGNWEFVTPSNAGIQFDWTNREDIDNAYVKFTLYGEFYESFWSASYTNTYVSLTCDRKNDLAYLCKQSEMLSLAESKLGVSNGYGFVVNYIYVQAFAKINGTMYRSRIYKFDADLVSDVGNAESEDDEYYPEITAGSALPSDYVPSSTNIDPEKTEPSADGSDDTLISTPVDGTNATIDNSSDLLDEFTDSSGAFSSFINVMRQGISLLGDFPSLVAAVFSYVPSYFLMFIGVGFAVAVVLRLMGR